MKPSAHVSPIPFTSRLTVRLTAGVIVVLLLIGSPFLLAFHKLLRTQQLEALTEATDDLSRLLADGLRSAMLAGKPDLLDEAVRSLAEQPDVERVILLDHRGRVRVSSDPSYDGRLLEREREVTCGACHGEGGVPPARRTAVTSEGGRRVFRAMSIIPNEPRCHGCHDPAVATNGVLLMDLALQGADRRFFTGIGSTIVLGAVMALLTVLVLVLLLQRMVHGPLNAVVTAGQRIVGGDLDARASVSSPGEFARLASQVNLTTEHLAKTLRTVESQHHELQTILDTVDDEIVVLDRDRRVVAANRAFRNRLGLPEREIAGRFCHDVSGSHWSCEIDRQGGCPVGSVFETGELHKGIVSRTGADGRERVVEIHASPLRGADGRVTHAVEVRRDISERRQMEAILAQSERLASLGLLATGLSHEINNPLGAIATAVEGLRRRLATTPGTDGEAAGSLEATLEGIAREVQRGRDITHRLLRVARPPGPRSLVDVNRVVRDIVAILSHDIERSGIRTRIELGQDLPPLVGDESRLAQVVMNLSLNAIQAMAEGGGELRIATSLADGAIQIRVEDSGCGIAPPILKRIYEPFFTTKPVGKGTGLGLFITHQIIAAMGGTIEVRSEPERMTSFTIRIPHERQAGP